MASRIFDPSGISIDGVLQVTGRLDPAISGNPIRRDVSYISLAQSQFHDRCLSLNTGTERPLSSNTLTICLKNSYLGYFVCPFSLRGYRPCSPTRMTPSTASFDPPSVRASAIVGYSFIDGNCSSRVLLTSSSRI